MTLRRSSLDLPSGEASTLSVRGAPLRLPRLLLSACDESTSQAFTPVLKSMMLKAAPAGRSSMIFVSSRRATERRVAFSVSAAPKLGACSAIGSSMLADTSTTNTMWRDSTATP